MTPDQNDEIETFNDPNSCYRPDDEQTYKITGLDGTEYHGFMQYDVIKYTLLELAGTACDILNAEDDEEAFERAKAYLELVGLMQYDVIKYALSELAGTACDILNAEDDEEAFERAKAYLELMDAIKEEKTDE